MGCGRRRDAFLTNCKINQGERDVLYCNVMQLDQVFMDDSDMTWQVHSSIIVIA